MNQEENFVLENHFSSTCGSTETSRARRCFAICATGSVFRYVQQATDDINWTIGQDEFDDFLALKTDSAPGLDGISFCVHRFAGGFGSKFLFRAYQAFLREALFLVTLLKVGPSLSERLLILLTSEGLSDHLMHVVHWHYCTIVTVNSFLLPYVEALLVHHETHSPHRDGSPPVKWRTTSLR